MDRPFKVAEDIVTAYDMSRGAGHTTAMLVGTTLVKSQIVVADMRHGNVIDGLRGSRSPSGTYMLPHEVLGRRRGVRGVPLVFDHYAMTLLLHSMIDEHVVSERQVTGLKDLLFKEAGRSANAERSCRDAQWELAKTRVDYEKDKSRWWYKLCKRIF